MVLLVLLAVLVGVQVSGVAAQRAADAAAEDRARLATEVERIRYYDEVLMMSARLAAASGDTAYVRRYDEAVPELEAALRAASRLAPDEAAQRAVRSTDAANDALVDLETEAFARLAAGDREGALGTVTGPRYDALKTTYRSGIEYALVRLETAARERQADAVARQRRSLAAAGAAAAVLSGLWALTARGLRRSRGAQTRLAEELRVQATTDPLTGLPNRRVLAARLSQCLAGPEDVVVLLVDVDRFTVVNDTLGHVAGDALLCEVACRLRAAAAARPGALVARLGGDEFAVVLPALGPGPAEDLARDLVAVLARPYAAARGLQVAGSVGLAGADVAGREAGALLRGADLALSEVKASGGGGSALFVPRMAEELVARVRTEGELRDGIARGEVELHYQPVVDVVSGRVAGIEALARWRHPVRGLLPPAEFVPLAETAGLVGPLGRAVLKQACRQLARWDAEHGEATASVAVNVSPRELLAPGYAGAVREVLRATGLAPGRLVLEVTESALMEGGRVVVDVLAGLRACGVRVSLDDFGTGHSSLARLQHLPLDELKIDRSFVAAAAPGDGAAADSSILELLVVLADRLGLGLVAEGVETPEQLALLRRLGCPRVQGWLLGRPQPPDHPQHRRAPVPAVPDPRGEAAARLLAPRAR